MFTTPEEDLAQILASPQYWMDKAKALRASAAAIWYWMDSDPPLDLSSALATDPAILNTGTWYVYRMLCGMSLELAYKASLAMGQKIKATHDLSWLADQVFPNVSRKERGLLELLTVHSLGRALSRPERSIISGIFRLSFVRESLS